MYDIFISYKNSDENSQLTEDYSIASKLYDFLTEAGYKVFFSKKSLQEIGSPQFKQEIDNALDEIKVMIVVLTKAEYATSKWVQYEWDSYYNDYLSGVRKENYLYTYTKGVKTGALPRTLRNIQNFNVDDGPSDVLMYIKNIMPLSRYKIKDNKDITFDDIKIAVQLDYCVYPGMEHVDPDECYRWFKLNPDIYVFIEDTVSGKLVAYTNTAPVTEDCYEKIKSGEFLTTNITEDMILSYDMPSQYSLYFFSIAIHLDHQNTEIVFMLINALVEKFVSLAKRDVFIKRMIADAVTSNGEKFCKLFGMKKVVQSTHMSTLYEVRMVPPEFKKISRKVKELYDCYQSIYDEAPYLFE